MENAESQLLQIFCSGFKLCLIAVLLMNTAHSASQGDIGRNNSKGSISISLNIPENTQLIVERSQNHDVIGENKYCLKVMPTNSRLTSNYYNIAGLDGSIPAMYNVAETAYESSSKIVQINNKYPNKDDLSELCSEYQYIQNQASINYSAVLIMLITE